MRLYIAGPMTGYPNDNFQAFDDAARALRDCGHHVISPADLSRARGWRHGRKPTNDEYMAFMREDVRAIVDCDGIVLLPGWETSKGATFERQVAEMTGRRIMFLEDCGGAA